MRLSFGQELFSHGSSSGNALAWQFWHILRREFPDALAMVLMPNHIHVLFDRRPSTWLPRSRRVALQCGRHKPRLKWEPVPPPVSIPDLQHLQRQLRYVHLNPCRARLVLNPLEWPWSTHRELCGLTLYRSPGVQRLQKLIQKTALEWHGYISADSSVEVLGTPLPQAPPSFCGQIVRAPNHAQLESVARSLFGFHAPVRRSREARALAGIWALNEKLLNRQTPAFATSYRLAKRFKSYFSQKSLDLIFLSATDQRLFAAAQDCPVRLGCAKPRNRTRSATSDNHVVKNSEPASPD